MHFYRSFIASIAFILSLLATLAGSLCYSSTIIDQHNSDGRKVRIEVNDGEAPEDVGQWQVSLLLPEDFNDRNSVLCFKAPVVSADSNSIALLVTNNPGSYCYQLVIMTEEQIPASQYVSQRVSKNGTIVRLKSTTADRPELISVTTDQLLNGKPHVNSLTLLVYSDNMAGSGVETGQIRNSSLTLTGGKLAGNADFSSGGNGHFFYSPPPPPWGGGGRPSGLFEIDLVILKPLITWLMSIGKDSISFKEQAVPARLQITRVNADGSSSEAAVPVGWLDFLDTRQLTDVDFWNTLLQRTATFCPASESLQWQLSCFKQFLESSALKAKHSGGLKAGNGDGEPSGTAPDTGSKNENNDHTKEERKDPEGQESRSPGEGNNGRGGGNNREDGDGEESEQNTTTQDLQELVNRLIAIIESGDPNAVFEMRQILDELDMPLRLQVLETKGTNVRGDAVTPLEAILALPGSFEEHSVRNRFIEQLVAEAAFIDPFRQVDRYQSASGSVGSSSSPATDRHLQQGARPKQLGRADNAGGSSGDHGFEKKQKRQQVAPIDTESQRLKERIEKIEEELRKQYELAVSIIRQMIQEMAADIPAMPDSGPENFVGANSLDKELPLPQQESIKSLCGHYHRRCLVKFECCDLYFSCHRCHNESDSCETTNSMGADATHLKCNVCDYEGEITEGSQVCPDCNERMSDYFCAKCKLFTGTVMSPFHCDKCGICRIHGDKSYHCDVCNICMDKRLKGHHKCRPDSGHDECAICLEDVFTGCQVLPCSHKVHKQCVDAMIENGVTSCPVCRCSFE